MAQDLGLKDVCNTLDLGGKLVVDGEGRWPSPKRISNPIMGNKERVADNLQMGFLEAHF